MRAERKPVAVVDVRTLSRVALEARCVVLERENATLIEIVQRDQSKLLRRTREVVGLRRRVIGARP